MGLCIDCQMRILQRGQVEVGDDLRITHRDGPARREVNIAKDSHVLVRWHGIPIHPGPPQIIGLRGEDLDRQGVQPARARYVSDV